ncbi:hypothetical protein A0J61_08948 [Choanephora cucurbitarum]|uniref:Uncharacterized protein n=1 Tax=Choanephora cucurbitarum TaxID=101091 RepID=A0A1C7N1J3_9FUNG|nr:hypothetical protein A0J61_08948 [Choanephora cucurbitarum]
MTVYAENLSVQKNSKWIISIVSFHLLPLFERNNQSTVNLLGFEANLLDSPHLLSMIQSSQFLMLS